MARGSREREGIVGKEGNDIGEAGRGQMVDSLLALPRSFDLIVRAMWHCFSSLNLLYSFPLEAWAHDGPFICLGHSPCLPLTLAGC